MAGQLYPGDASQETVEFVKKSVSEAAANLLLRTVIRETEESLEVLQHRNIPTVMGWLPLHDLTAYYEAARDEAKALLERVESGEYQYGED